ncbi:6-bladed beta-propeller [Parabacteroides sp. PF5-6]|uniref:6-bladed beta-propeller n=1 Tax=Parabacteroides sp. PF5-6 TaxID=1742403 RepID=UPI002406AA8A|nr:6-bladed beta-propeller [Parabacteroides sp. PF5-6]MDF9830041.1 hypothetical protein [Parabacteroides sp. PF5-6]
MRLKHYISGLFAVCLLACAPRGQEFVAIDLSKDKFEAVTLTLEPYVKQWIRVDLETTSEALITPYHSIYPCRHSIVVYNYNRIMEFDYTGKYLGEIAGPGEGPDEIGSLIDCQFDTDNNRLYWIDRLKPDHIRAYDLNTHTHLPPVPIAARRMLYAFRVIDRSTLLCFPYMGSRPQRCYFQDMEGRFIRQENPSFEDPEGPFVATPLKVFAHENEWFYQGILEDTVYSATTREPLMSLAKGKSATPQEAMLSPENKLNFLNPLFYTTDTYWLAHNLYEVRPVQENSFEMFPVRQRCFRYHLKEKQMVEVTGLYFEPLDKTYTAADIGEWISKVSALNPAKVVVNYPADELSPEASDENPILFIGDLK